MQNEIREVRLHAFQETVHAAERTIALLKAFFDIVTNLDMSKMFLKPCASKSIEIGARSRH